MDLGQQLVETWEINNRINLYLLDSIDPKSLSDVSASKGRTAGEQIAHVHNVRLMWLQSAAPDLLKDLKKIEKNDASSKALLKNSLTASGKAIAELIKKSLDTGGKVRGFKPHAVAFVGYLISHEAHHRGQLAVTLKQSGHPLDKKISFGIFEWGVR